MRGGQSTGQGRRKVEREYMLYDIYYAPVNMITFLSAPMFANNILLYIKNINNLQKKDNV